MTHLRATIIGFSVVLAGLIGCANDDGNVRYGADASGPAGGGSPGGGGSGGGAGGSGGGAGGSGGGGTGTDASTNSASGNDAGGEFSQNMDGGSGGTAGGGLPCDVQAVVQDNCVQCHGSSLRAGAPMSLVTYEDFTASAVSSSQPVAEVVQQRINSESNPMPPQTSPLVDGPLTQDELSTMNSWIDNDYPRSDETCESSGGGGGSDGGTSMGDGGTPEMPEDCDMRHEFRAHNGQQAGDTTPYQVPLQTDRYECFNFKAPWGSTEVQGLSFAPLVDDSRVLHHWILYATNDSSIQPGSHQECLGAHGDAAMVTGWAPGGQPVVMPDNVGMQLPSGSDARFILEIHYNNAAGHQDATDRSGVEVCATSDFREHTAAVHWLGTEFFNIPPGGESSVSSTCNPNLSQEAHIIGWTPHMHRLGTHFKGTIQRADGSTEVFHDKPFEFENQRTYFEHLVVQPGDSITTTCTWNNTTGGFVGFGPGTSDEMCYNFVLAYPVGSLTDGTAGFTTSTNSCIQ